jgi:metal-dependent amidase/aminoacylase/carboxypeptidase family protein
MPVSCSRRRIRGLWSKTPTTNVAVVLGHMQAYLAPGDYLVVEDSDVKREALRAFLGLHPGSFLVDTRFTDNFGRNATCAADSIFIRTKQAAAAPEASPHNSRRPGESGNASWA